jgi:hypothetical protein
VDGKIFDVYGSINFVDYRPGGAVDAVGAVEAGIGVDVAIYSSSLANKRKTNAKITQKSGAVENPTLKFLMHLPGHSELPGR